MSLRSLQVIAGAGVSRREMLGTLARWTVPTVLSMTLISRVAQAAPSCPPCTKRSGSQCKACTMNQILNCQCEPCLGAPYCSGGVRSPASGIPSGQPGQTGGVSQYTGPGANNLSPTDQLDYLNSLRQRQGVSSDNPFDLKRNPIYRSPFSTSPLGASRPYGRTPGDTALRTQPRGLYDRLRPNERRPF